MSNKSRVEEIVKNKPYFICRKKSCTREELRSDFGEILSEYGREQDEANDEYLVEAFEALINQERESARREELKAIKEAQARWETRAYINKRLEELDNE